MSLKERIINWVLKGFLETFSTGEVNLRTRVVLWFAGRELNSYFKEAEKMGEKKWIASRTVWTNIFVAIIGVLTAFTQDGGLNPKTVGILTTIIGIVNIVLRMITDKPISN